MKTNCYIKETKLSPDSNTDLSEVSVENQDTFNLDTTLTKSKVLRIMRDLEDRLDFSGFNLSVKDGLNGYIEGFEYLLNKRIGVVIDELEELYDSTGGFNNMDSEKEIYDDLLSKSNDFWVRVSDLHDDCVFEERSELIKECVVEFFDLRTSCLMLLQDKTNKIKYLKVVLSITKKLESLLTDIVSKGELDNIEEMTDEILGYLENCQTEIESFKRKVKNMTEKVFQILDKEVKNTNDENNYDLLLGFLKSLDHCLGLLKVILISEEERCEKIEEDWEQLYLEFTDSVFIDKEEI